MPQVLLVGIRGSLGWAFEMVAGACALVSFLCLGSVEVAVFPIAEDASGAAVSAAGELSSVTAPGISVAASVRDCAR